MKKINLFKKEKIKALWLADKLHTACVERLMLAPELTKEEANKLLATIVEQAGGIKDLSFEKFEELFTGTLEALGIDTSTKEEAVEEKDKNINRLWGLTKKGWEQRAKLDALTERVKGIKLKMPEKMVTDEEAGAAVGKAASNVAKPFVWVYDKVTSPFTSKTAKGLVKGFKDGWKNG